MMIDGTTQSAGTQPISVGVYGYTAAGKTRFLFQLLHTWERDRRLLVQSANCQMWLKTVEAEIEQHGRSLPTTAPRDGIETRVRQGEREPPLEWVFRDLRGEFLADELDGVVPDGRERTISPQVKRCDAFLFFFDPASSEARDAVEAHHKRELNRAERFIEYVLSTRENRHLPIVFVLTHLDTWERDEAVCERAGRWIEEVHSRLQSQYGVRLGTHYPPQLIEKAKVAVRVSSTTGTGVEQVAERLAELVTAARKFAAADRRRVRWVLAAGLLALALMGLAAWWVAGAGSGARPASASKTPDRSEVMEWGEKEVTDRLDDLERLVKSHPPGDELPTAEEAKKVNAHLKWLTTKIDMLASNSGDGGPTEATRERMRAVLDKTSNQVAAKVAAKGANPAERSKVLAAYLEGLPDVARVAPELSRAQSSYWMLQRRVIVNQLAQLIAIKRDAGTPPIDVLVEFSGRAKDFEREVRGSTVYGPDPQDKLSRELKVAAAFCDDRIKAKSYEARFKISAASAANADGSYRAIVVDPDTDLKVTYALKPSTGDAGAQTYTTKEASYRMKFGLNPKLICRLLAHTDGENWKTLHDFVLPEVRGPLSPLGLPLHRRNQPQLNQALRWEGYSITVEFSDHPDVPALLWEAGERAGMEGKP